MTHSNSNQKFLLDHLEIAAQQLGVTIRYENLTNPTDNDSTTAVRSGRYRLKNKTFIIVSKNLGLMQKTALLAQELGQLDLSQIYLPPLVRDYLHTVNPE